MTRRSAEAFRSSAAPPGPKARYIPVPPVFSTPTVLSTGKLAGGREFRRDVGERLVPITLDDTRLFPRGTLLAIPVLSHTPHAEEYWTHQDETLECGQLENHMTQTGRLATKARPEDENATIHSFGGMVAVVCSPSMKQLLEKVRKTANTDAAVLITGETGCGKELIARAIHHHSLRCTRAWVDVQCAALPDHLLESELFGYERGAFSGAATQKPGMFELANGGTLFLDEVGELNPQMQVKLLRVLDGVPYYRLGGTRKVTTDVRIVAATNANLEEAVERGVFRRDLYHRLDQARLNVPSLKSRPEDIVALSRYFLTSQFPDLQFSESALHAIRTYSWPGNVRELRNAVIKAALSADSDLIELSDLPEGIQSGVSGSGPVGRTLEQIERQAILGALSETGGRQEPAAQLLGISTRTLIRKLKLYRGHDEPESMLAVAL